MSTTVTYKGSTLTTVNNQTRVLETAGTWLEDDITLTDVSASSPTLITKNISTNGTYNASSDSADGFSSVVVNVPTGITPTGTKQINISQNGTTTEDVTNYASAQITVNVPSSSPSQAQHTIYFEFSDNTNTSITGYWDDAFISNSIRATTPTTYNNKTVTLARLDGTTWYEPAAIPLNTQLIDYNAVTNNYIVDGDTGELTAQEGGSASDYTQIDPSMTFKFIGYTWFDCAFYDSSKAYISGFRVYDYADSTGSDFPEGTLSASRIPSNAAYIRITSFANPDDTQLSLIRTA